MLEITSEPPIVKINTDWFASLPVTIYMKRDDLLHPFVSGNKWRKLKYVLQDAQLNKKTHLVSFGGAYSNHLVALSNAGKSFGFQTTAFVRGEFVENHMLNYCKNFGMHLIFVSREAYRNKTDLYNTYFAEDSSTYFIDEGGKGALAAKGCEHILMDVDEFSHVFCAVGTGTTLAGMARATKNKNMVAEGICVLKGASDIDQEVDSLAGFPIKIHHTFHRGGYAKIDDELIAFMRAFYSHTGIMLDQVYTAKMVLGVLELAQSGYFQHDSKLLLIHTGGVLGNTAI